VPKEFADLLEKPEDTIESVIISISNSVNARSQIISQRSTVASENLQEILRIEPHEDKVESGDTLWSYITSSRDQTRSSDFGRVKLLILRSRLYEVPSEFEDTIPDSRYLAVSTAGLLSPPPPLPLLTPLLQPNFCNLPSSSLGAPTAYPFPAPFGTRGPFPKSINQAFRFWRNGTQPKAFAILCPNRFLRFNK
jgi:hypothetical protein